MIQAGEIVGDVLDDDGFSAKLAALAAQAPSDEELRLEREEADRQFAAEQAQRHEQWKAKRVAESGVPLRVREVLAGQLAETKALHKAREWIDRRKADRLTWCLVLSGDKGCGKSVAAGLWLRDLWMWMQAEHEQAKRGPVLTGEQEPTPPQLAWLPVSRFARLGAYDGEFDRYCQLPGPLVVDDLGSEYLDAKGWLAQALDAFIDARYSECRPTLITTNLNAADFKKRYSERIADRVREGGVFSSVTGASLRGRP